MPSTAELVRRLRAEGAAAVVSGAGPSALVLCASRADADGVVALVETWASTGTSGSGWRVLTPDVDHRGAHLLDG
jgi:homoserine kinase